MDELNTKSPGVYVNEVNAFPNAVTPVATAVPAFVGYTPQALYGGKSYTNVPRKISSFAEFQAIYCLPNPPAPAPPTKPYSPEYYLVKQNSEPAKGNYILINGAFYAILPDPNTIYYLYNSVRIFYDNGGGDAYIVSVGSYGAPSKTPINPGDQIVNPNVKLNDLLNGLNLLKNELEPTLYIFPEATLLTVDNNGALMQSILMQCMEIGTVVAIFDIIGGRDPDPVLYLNDIKTFRENTGSQGLSYGAAYYPFVGTTMMQNYDIDYTNLFGGDIAQLAAIINAPENPNPEVAAVISAITSGSLSVTQYHDALTNVSKTYGQIIGHVLSDANILPPSGAMAGVIATIDNQQGVWHAPANTSIVGVASLPIRLSESQQANLNVDAVSGKSINAIRFFDGLGILVWGARTLDGNSLDWKYLSVRRTVTFLEQSCKQAARAYVFQPNNENIWDAVKLMISNFLNSVWNQGGLQGATPGDAYAVACGLGATMTADDLLLGFMKVTVKVAVIRPAEFIVITFQQQMAPSS